MYCAIAWLMLVCGVMIRCNLETLLETKGWTRYRLGVESGVHNAVLAKYAKNEVREFNADTLNAICATLACEVGELIEYVPETPRASTKKGPGQRSKKKAK